MSANSERFFKEFPLGEALTRIQRQLHFPLHNFCLSTGPVYDIKEVKHLIIIIAISNQKLKNNEISCNSVFLCLFWNTSRTRTSCVCVILKGRVNSIFLKTNIYTYTKLISAITSGPLDMCSDDYICRAPTSACILMFWFSLDISGWGVDSVVPERVQWTIVHEFVHILGERERTVLYLRLNALLLNALILAFVSGVLNSVHECVPDVQSLPGETPAKTHRKQALIFSRKPPNLATASCLSVAPTNTSLSVVTTTS